jgi:hypothetical protein
VVRAAGWVWHELVWLRLRLRGSSERPRLRRRH